MKSRISGFMLLTEALISGLPVQMIINGKWADGSPIVAIPNYARCNRFTQPVNEKEVKSIVWIKKQ